MSERFVEGVRLTNPDKVLYPEQGITKSDLADHYVAVAERMLPHVAMRPITMVRCPTGRQRKCFYQRHAGAGVPKSGEPSAFQPMRCILGERFPPHPCPAFGLA